MYRKKTTFLFEEGSPVLQINVDVERTELANASFTQKEVRFSKLISLSGKLGLPEVQLTLKE